MSKDNEMWVKPLKDISDKSALVQYYPLLKRATNGNANDPETPGYIYEELTELTFKGSSGTVKHLVVFLTGYLGGTNVTSKRRSLKTLLYLCQNGSREFRRHLRNQDDCLKISESDSDEKVRSTSSEIRTFLFDDNLLESDEKLANSPEKRPDKIHTAGMGSDGGGDGFGSARKMPNLGDKVMDFLEKSIYAPDQKEEVLKMCLENPTVGEYKPITTNVDMTMNCSRSSTSSEMGRKKAVVHVPGKAGGGWESSSEEEDDEEKAKMSELDKEVDSASEALEDDEEEPGPEKELVNGFCEQDGFPEAKQVRNCFNRACDMSCVKIIYQICEKLSEDNPPENVAVRALLLLEHFLRTDLVKAAIYKATFTTLVMEQLGKNTSEVVRVKARKVSLIIKNL